MTGEFDIPDHIKAALEVIAVADAERKAAAAELERLRIEVMDPAVWRANEAASKWEGLVNELIPQIVRCVPPLPAWDSAVRASTRAGQRATLVVHYEEEDRWSGAILISIPGLVRNVIGWASAPDEARARRQLDEQWIRLGGELT